MPRLDGSMSFMRWPSIDSSPTLTLSSPAIKRSRVDFPHPDGPTKTQNSPVLISRSMLSSTCVWPKYLPIPRIEMHVCPALLDPLSGLASVMASPLYCARRQARDDPALEDEDQDDERQGHDDRRGHDVAPRELVRAGAAHERDADRDGALVVGQGEGQREHELVPRRDEGQEPRRDQGRPHERHEH